MESAVDFSPLLIVTLLAVAVPFLLQRLSRLFVVPIVVGEIVAGIVVGPSGFGLIGEPNSWLEFLKLFGFSYLMFLSGLEIDFDLLAAGGRRRVTGPWARLVGTPVRAALLSFAVTVLASLAFAVWLVRIDLARDPVVIALILSTTSLGLVMPVLKERGLTSTDLGQHILVAAVVCDFATVFLISTYVIVYTEGLTFEILFVLILLAATFLVYRLAELFQRHLPLERWIEELSHATAQLDVRGSLALALVFIALAQGLGVEVILGAFIAGAIISLLSEEHGSMLRPKLEALGYGFFIPIFFIMVGVDFNLAALFGSSRGWVAVVAIVLAAFAVKYVAALVYRPLFSWREVLALGSLSSARLSLIIAVAAIGFEIGAISETMNSAIILVAIVTVLAAPVLFNRLIPESRKRGLKRRIVVVGSPPQARLLARRLRDRGENLLVIAADRRFVEEAREAGLEAVLVDPGRRVEAIEDLDSAEVGALVCLLDDEDASAQVATAAKRRAGIETVIAQVHEPELAERLRSRGIQVVDPGQSLVMMLEAMARNPQAFSLLTEEAFERHVEAVRMRNLALEGRLLRQVPLPGDALIMLLARDGEVVVPRGYTRLRRGDLLTIVGSPDSIASATEIFS